MWNSNLTYGLRLGVSCAFLAAFLQASGQQQAQGFAFERLYTSAPGAGWIVMDALDMHGDFGGTVEIGSNSESNPVQIGGGTGEKSLNVISTAETLDFGLAATYKRYRLYANFATPLRFAGTSGTVGEYTFTTPNISFGPNPDNIGDVRLGFDARLFGREDSPLRLGVGAQLYLPNDDRANYDTDGTFRSMVRGLAAGDHGAFTYAGQVGVHIRPLDESYIPESPKGNELLFGAAGGIKIPVRATQRAVLGAEFYGASAFQDLFQTAATDKEWLISSRYEGTSDHGRQGRVKVGVGRGISPQFGAPRWRVVASVELFGWEK